MLKVIDTIEGSGFPLGFRYSKTSQRSSLVLGQVGNDSINFECRAMGAKTCYLHAALSTRVIPKISIFLNNETI